ncbi:glycosyltransferase [Mycobacterium bourgelatii]|uniref:glycosyltransferase n=1 Tax=Mycobacterium bourgelatii TaxID=1273442 RepID=UPI001F08060A|nr:glycosyltransferase [Mycobacterium bourgelatii]
MSAALASLGHDVTAYERRGDHNRKSAAAAGHRTVSTPVGPRERGEPRELLPYVGEWADELAQRWSSKPPDVVNAHGWLGGLAAQLAARRPGLPTVQSFYGVSASPTSVEDTERARLEPVLARNATWVTGGSGDDVDGLAKMRRSRAKLSILSTGVDVERFAPVGPELPPVDLHRILCLAPNPDPCNGFDRVIRLMPRLSDAELVIVETGPTDQRFDRERAALQKLAADLAVGHRIHFAGNVTGDDLPTLVRSADVVVCPPRHSPRATAALQAMASAVVVVAVDTGALTDTVIHGVTGLLVAPDQPGELVSALKTILAERFQRQSMGASGRSRATSRFTWDRIALDATNIYQQAIAAQSPGTTRARGEHCVTVR